jgi:hypothetical protein
VIGLAIVLGVIGALLIYSAFRLQEERDGHAATRRQLGDTKKALRAARSEIVRAEEARLKQVTDTVELAAASYDTAEALATARRERDALAARLRSLYASGRVLPDAADDLDRVPFDDAGPSPVFDSMPIGLLAPAVAAIGAAS